MLHKSSETLRHCLAKAEECEQRAKSASRLKSKARFREIAADWRRLAKDEDYLKSADAFASKHTG
jgi:hypothetical protein